MNNDVQKKRDRIIQRSFAPIDDSGFLTMGYVTVCFAGRFDLSSISDGKLLVLMDSSFRDASIEKKNKFYSKNMTGVV